MTMADVSVDHDSGASPAAQQGSSKAVSTWQSILLSVATVAIILLGVGLILSVALLPTIWAVAVLSRFGMENIFKRVAIQGITFLSFHCSSKVLIRCTATSITVLWQCIHWCLLWYSTWYLAALRFLVLPIRIIVMPMVLWVAKVESIRDNEPTMHHRYVPSADMTEDATNPDEASSQTPLLHIHGNQRLRKIRQRKKQMKRTFERSRIRHEYKYSETSLNLSQMMPILWNHEARLCNHSNVMKIFEEFLKRFLVVSVTPFAILDMYYHVGPCTVDQADIDHHRNRNTDASPNANITNDGTNRSTEAESTSLEHQNLQSPTSAVPDLPSNRKLVAFQLSYQQGTTWHWFMYFCHSDHSKCGIWFHGVTTAMERGRVMPHITHLNGFTHQIQSKQNAGLDICVPDAEGGIKLLQQLYKAWPLPRPVSKDTLQQVGSIWSEG